MKKTMVLTAATLAAFLVSCVSMQDGQMTWQERAQANIVGSVSTEFTSFQFFHGANERNLVNRARIELTRVAQQQYGINVEVRNISISGGASGWGILYSIGIPVVAYLSTMIGWGGDYFRLIGAGIVGGSALITLNIIGNFQRITATGDVVLHGAGTGFAQADQRLVGAVNTAAQTLIGAMPQNASVAILNVHSHDPAAAAFILDELEFRLVGAGRFSIVDRQRLEQIRVEQQFHISGEVSDASAVSIGNMLGAGFVVTGDIGTDLLGDRLTLRVLNVSTGQIMLMVLERF